MSARSASPSASSAAAPPAAALAQDGRRVQAVLGGRNPRDSRAATYAGPAVKSELSHACWHLILSRCGDGEGARSRLPATAAGAAATTAGWSANAQRAARAAPGARDGDGRAKYVLASTAKTRPVPGTVHVKMLLRLQTITQ